MSMICRRRLAVCHSCHKACAYEEAERALSQMRAVYPGVVRMPREIDRMQRDLTAALQALNNRPSPP